MTYPVVLFVYNRPDHTRRTLEALAANAGADETKLYIFSDGSRDEAAAAPVAAVRKLIAEWGASEQFATVVIDESPLNRGLAQAIIRGVSKVLESHSACVVLEDDLVTRSDFLAYMSGALAFYEADARIGSITGYSPLRDLPDDYRPAVYAVPRTSSHGWGVWKDRWDRVDWTLSRFAQFETSFALRQAFNACGSDRGMRLRRQVRQGMKSWSVVFGFSQFMDGCWTIYPRDTRLTNIGNDGSGENVGAGTAYNDARGEPTAPVFERVEPDPAIIRAFHRATSGSLPSQVKRFVLNNLPAWGSTRKAAP